MLAFPRVIWLSVALGVGLGLFGAGTGYLLDDYFHLLRLETLEGWARLDLYSFAPGDPDLLEVEDAYPTRVAFAFDRPLEDPTLVFLHWDEGRLRRLPLPAVDETIELPRGKGPVWLP